MTWERRLVVDAGPSADLRPLVANLLAQQRATWPLLRQGEAALAGAHTKRLVLTDASVVVQSNPGRMVSSSARVDPASVAQRPCFLCEPNLPPEEQGIGFGADYFIAPNPFPIVRDHLSIPSRDHVPQALAGRVPQLVALARGLGSGMLVLYNGPRCGASAPDHFHFQAGSAVGLPIVDELGPATTDTEVTPIVSFGRRLVAIQGDDPARVIALVERAVDSLTQITGESVEPMLNLVATHDSDHYAIYFFPRRRHRPACYFAEGESRLLLSPGALDMAGLLVVADPSHFDRVDAVTARAVFEEVTLDRPAFERLVEVMT